MNKSWQPPKPSVFTPFLRRFTDERARDTEETYALYNDVRAHYVASPYADEDAAFAFTSFILSDFVSSIPAALFVDFHMAAHDIVSLETAVFGFPDTNLDSLSLKEQVDLRRYLRAKEYFFANEEKVLKLVHDGLALIFSNVARLLPETYDPSPFTIPLVYTLSEPKKLIDQILSSLCERKYVEAAVFVDLSNQLFRNYCAVSGIADPENAKKPLKYASENDAPLQEIVDAYLKNTPLRDFFLAPVPLKFTHEERFSHMHVVGGSGAGKTQLLQNLILNDLQSEAPPALVIVDSQGDLINKISRLALFAGPLADRLVLITPKDLDYPPALNIFDVNQGRLGAYDALTREQVVAGVIQTFDYLFTGLLGADLTAKQGVFFRYVARLMLALPETLGRNATILDMIDLMEDAAPYAEAIRSLPEIPRRFFERDFPSKTFAQTKEQIRYRLQAILENPTLARLFTSPETKVDLFKELNKGSIILVDTAKDFLKGASSHFGRIFISLVLQAVLERAVIPEAKRKPAFLFVDEAASYFDSNIDDLLTEARKYKLGCVFAHQFLDQCTSSLRASLAANTAIKFAGGVSTADARALAPEMRTTQDFILSQARLHFAAFIRHVTPQAVSIPISVGELEKQERLSEGAYKAMRERNRERVGTGGPIQPGQRPQDVRAREVGNRMESQSADTPSRRPDTEASEDW